MSQPTTVSLQITRGDDQAWDITFDQDVAGFSAIYLTIRTDYATTETDDTAAAAQLALGTGIVVTGVRTVRATMSSAVARGLTYGRYVHDVQVTVSATGKRHTTQRGSVYVWPDVTRS